MTKLYEGRINIKTGKRPFNLKAHILIHFKAFFWPKALVDFHNQFMTMSPQEMVMFNF